VTRHEEVSSILSNFNGSSQEISAIANDFVDHAGVGGLPIKQLLLTTELAIERSNHGVVEHGNFMSSLENMQ